MIVDNLFKKSGTKSRGVLHFVPLRRFYDVLLVPLFCRPRETCGRLWKTTWLHNVDNIRQKDIKMFLNRVRKMICYYMNRLAHTLLQLLILQKKRSETPIFNICPTVGFRQNTEITFVSLNILFYFSSQFVARCNGISLWLDTTILQTLLMVSKFNFSRSVHNLLIKIAKSYFITKTNFFQLIKKKTSEISKGYVCNFFPTIIFFSIWFETGIKVWIVFFIPRGCSSFSKKIQNRCTLYWDTRKTILVFMRSLGWPPGFASAW
jgi:hypothetical protein